MGLVVRPTSKTQTSMTSLRDILEFWKFWIEPYCYNTFQIMITKVLIGLRGCAGWSVPLLFAWFVCCSFDFLTSKPKCKSSWKGVTPLESVSAENILPVLSERLSIMETHTNCIICISPSMKITFCCLSSYKNVSQHIILILLYAVQHQKGQHLLSSPMRNAFWIQIMYSKTCVKRPL